MILITSRANIAMLNCGGKIDPSTVASGAAVIPRLRPVSDQIRRLFNSEAFSTSQRKYNGLFSITALGAGGCEPKNWTNPAPPSMLT